MNSSGNTPRWHEIIAVPGGFARCHRPPGHQPPHHASGRTWYSAGEAGQRLRLGRPHFADCLPLPEPPRRRPGNAGDADVRADQVAGALLIK